MNADYLTDRNAALEVFFRQVLRWCEGKGTNPVQSDVLSTFDITDEVWEVLRPMTTLGYFKSCENCGACAWFDEGGAVACERCGAPAPEHEVVEAK